MKIEKETTPLFPPPHHNILQTYLQTFLMIKFLFSFGGKNATFSLKWAEKSKMFFFKQELFSNDHCNPKWHF